MEDLIKRFAVNDEEIEVTESEARKFVEMIEEALEDWDNSSDIWKDFVI